MQRSMLARFLAVVFAFVLTGVVDGGSALTAQPTSAGNLEISFGVKIPMRDGVELNSTIFFPPGPRTPRPVIFAMTPYMADGYHRHVLPAARRGYVMAVVDVRGRGGSGGVFEPFAVDAKDGYDAIAWLAKQPWSNGKIGMMGGSYGGFNQWSIAKEFPPALVTIAPTASAFLGVDVPHLGGMNRPYWAQWITFVSARVTHPNLFGDQEFWQNRFRALYLNHVPYAALDSVAGNPSPAFQRWIDHPTLDSYWSSMAPSDAQLARLNIPIFTRTGIYDGDQIGALEHYRRHMRYGSAEAKAKHVLMIGPWDHAGTRTPQVSFGGLSFDSASVFSMGDLEADWYDWVIKGGPRPARLPKRVTYYVTGAEEWKHADNLEDIGANPTTFYLTSAGNAAGSVTQSGSLTPQQPAATAADRWRYDPLDIGPGREERAAPDLASARFANELGGRGAIYHTTPFDRPTEISGFAKLTLWLTASVP
ncbi:MAG: CocE/NonD family hydrolase, partial [Gemmatimonadales bacterium]